MPITNHMSNPLKGLHDSLLAEKPDGASHDESTCPLCAMESANNEGKTFDDQPEGGSMSDKTFTEEELKAAVEKAVGEATSALEAKLNELEGSVQQSEIDKAVAATKAEADDIVKELQTKLDEAVLLAQSEKQAREDLEAKIASDAEQLAAEARKEDRVAAVKEVASFPDDYVATNTDRWAGMDDTEFAQYVEDLKVVAVKSEDEGVTKKVTSMQASREEGGKNDNQGSHLGELGFLRKTLRGQNNF